MTKPGDVKVGDWRWAPDIVAYGNAPKGYPVEVLFAGPVSRAKETDFDGNETKNSGKPRQHCKILTADGQHHPVIARSLGRRAPAAAVRKARRHRLALLLCRAAHTARLTYEVDGDSLTTEERNALADAIATLEHTIGSIAP